MPAETVRIETRDLDGGLIVATSPDDRGLYTVAKSQSELRDMVVDALMALDHARGKSRRYEVKVAPGGQFSVAVYPS